MSSTRDHVAHDRSSVRVYLPSTLTLLRRLLDDGAVTGAPLPGYAVTDDVRAYYDEGDDEELDLLALDLAAAASVRLLDADPSAVRRRVVVVVESARVEAVPRVDRAAVRVLADVALRDVQAVHVDDPAAIHDVTAAADALVAADLGSEPSQLLVEEAAGHELGWYATQEIGPLLELL